MRVTFPIAIALAMTIASQPAMAQDGGATVTKDLGCYGFIPTASGGLSNVFLYTADGSTIFLAGAIGQGNRKDGKWADYGRIHIVRVQA